MTSEVGKAAQGNAEIAPKAEKPFATPPKTQADRPAQVGDMATGDDLDQVRAEQNINNPNYEADRQAAVDSLEF